MVGEGDEGNTGTEVAVEPEIEGDVDICGGDRGGGRFSRGGGDDGVGVVAGGGGLWAVCGVGESGGFADECLGDGAAIGGVIEFVIGVEFVAGHMINTGAAYE